MILYYCRTASCIQYYGKVPVTAGIVCQTQYPGTGRPVLFATPSPLLRLLKTVFCIVTDFYEARPSFVPAFLCPGLGSRLSVYNTVNIFIFRDLVPGYAYAHTFLRSVLFFLISIQVHQRYIVAGTQVLRYRLRWKIPGRPTDCLRRIAEGARGGVRLGVCYMCSLLCWISKLGQICFYRPLLQ